MSLILATCVEYDEKRKICVAEENGKKYTLNNHSEFKVRKVKIDKCLHQAHREKRCDYLMNIDPKELKRAIFIELKGGGLGDAVKQIYSTITHLKSEFKDHQIDARIVGSSNVPGIRNTPDCLRLERVVRSTSGTLEIATNRVYSEDI
jgi:hypothetical protein